MTHIVSIPLRGKGKGKAEVVKDDFSDIIEFPSPYGERVKESVGSVDGILTSAAVSIPLRGKGKGKENYVQFFKSW